METVIPSKVSAACGVHPYKRAVREACLAGSGKKAGIKLTEACSSALKNLILIIARHQRRQASNESRHWRDAHIIR
jgi:hypothetical protein